MNLTHEDVQEILRLLDASPFDELQLETDRFKLTLRRRGSGAGDWTQETQTLGAARIIREEPTAAPASESAIARNAGSAAAPTSAAAVAMTPSATARTTASAAATAAKAPHAATPAPPVVTAPAVAPATPHAAATAPSATARTTASAAAPPPPTTINILTPIIGTFYRAPKPGAAPFVEVGSEVTPNTVIGIVETMKLMNSVYAGAHGKIVEICQGDGKFVEQDQILMRLNPV